MGIDGHWYVSTAPAAEPLSAADAKTHMRVDTDADDTYIGQLITAARQYVEGVTNRALITQTLKLYLDEWPDEEIILPAPPAQSVTSISYVDGNGDSQTWASANYTLDIRSEPARIVRAYGVSFPTLRDVIQAVTITYVAGYGAAGSNVPTALVQAIKILVAHWYENREPVVAGTIITGVPMTVDSLIWHYKVPEIY